MANIFSPCRRLEDCGTPLYDPKIHYFTIRLWYNGELLSQSYKGGDVEFFDWCHYDNVDYELLDKWMLRLGCRDTVTYFWKPTNEVWQEIQPLNDDITLFGLLSKASLDTLVDVFVKHIEDIYSIEAVVFEVVGRSIGKLQKVYDWEELVNSIDGSVFIYRERAYENLLNQQPRSCTRRLFDEHGGGENVSGDQNDLFSWNIPEDGLNIEIAQTANAISFK